MFPKGRVPKELTDGPSDAESQKEKAGLAKRSSEDASEHTAVIQRQTAVFTWKDVVYDIKIKKEDRRILDHVDGWVKPGTLTALMVSSQQGVHC